MVLLVIVLFVIGQVLPWFAAAVAACLILWFLLKKRKLYCFYILAFLIAVFVLIRTAPLLVGGALFFFLWTKTKVFH
jgi:hypothetical protein